MRGPRLLAAAALLGLTSVSACTSDAAPEPAPLPSASVSPSPSASASATAPTLPAEASGTSAKAAKAFVRAYVEAVNYATATGDLEALDALADPQCKSCGSVSDRIDDVYSAGGSIVSDGWRVRSISLVPGQPETRPILDVSLFLPSQEVVEKSGDEPKTFNGGKLPATFYLINRDARWLIARWERSA